MSSKLVLVLNCGSSSLKFAILDAVNGDEYLSGLAECFHLPEARIKWKMDGSKQEAELGAGAAHSEALNFIVNTILAQKPELSAQLTAIGHRIVHGGEKYTSSVVIDESVIQGIKDAASFAPLHNPAHLIGIAEALKSFPHLKDKTWLYSIRRSIRPCRKNPISTPCRTACTKSTAFVVTARTAPATST